MKPNLSEIEISARKRRTLERGPSNPNFDGGRGLGGGGFSGSSSVTNSLTVSVTGAEGLSRLTALMSALNAEISRTTMAQSVAYRTMATELQFANESIQEARGNVSALTMQLKFLEAAAKATNLAQLEMKFTQGISFEKTKTGYLNMIEAALAVKPVSEEEAANLFTGKGAKASRESVVAGRTEFLGGLSENQLASLYNNSVIQERLKLLTTIKIETAALELKERELVEKQREGNALIQEKAMFLNRVRAELDAQIIAEERLRVVQGETPAQREERMRRTLEIERQKDEYRLGSIATAEKQWQAENKIAQVIEQELNDIVEINEYLTRIEDTEKRRAEQKAAMEQKYKTEVAARLVAGENIPVDMQNNSLYTDIADKDRENRRDFLSRFNKTQAAYARTVGVQYSPVTLDFLYKHYGTKNLDTLNKKLKDHAVILEEDAEKVRTYNSELGKTRQGMMQLSITFFVLFITTKQLIDSLDQITAKHKEWNEAVKEVGGSFTRMMPIAQVAISVSQLLTIQLTALTGSIMGVVSALGVLYFIYKAFTAESGKAKLMYALLAGAMLYLTIMSWQQVAAKKAERTERGKNIIMMAIEANRAKKLAAANAALAASQTTTTVTGAATATAGAGPGAPVMAAIIIGAIALVTAGVLLSLRKARSSSQGAFTVPGEDRLVSVGGIARVHPGEHIYTPSGRTNGGGIVINIDSNARLDQDTIRKLTKAINRGV